eukprot:11155155-Lingulodinium_polyedra.AAC.1
MGPCTVPKPCKGTVGSSKLFEPSWIGNGFRAVLLVQFVVGVETMRRERLNVFTLIRGSAP